MIVASHLFFGAQIAKRVDDDAKNNVEAQNAHKKEEHEVEHDAACMHRMRAIDRQQRTTIPL